MYAEHTLLISGSEKGVEDVSAFLRQSGCGNVTVVFNSGEARRLVTQCRFELIVLNTPLRDEFGVEMAHHLSVATTAGIILICKGELVEEMAQRMGENGVVCLGKPLSKTALRLAIRTASSFHHRLETLSLENQKLRAKLEENRVVSRAKLMLIIAEGISEEEAHHQIEKRAMDTRRPKREIAEGIIREMEKKRGARADRRN